MRVQKRVQSRAYAPPQGPPTRSPPITRDTTIPLAAAHTAACHRQISVTGHRRQRRATLQLGCSSAPGRSRAPTSSAPFLMVALAALTLTVPMSSSMLAPTFTGTGPGERSIESTSAVVGIHRMLRSTLPPLSGSTALFAFAAAPHFVDHLLLRSGRWPREDGAGIGSPGTWSPR